MESMSPTHHGNGVKIDSNIHIRSSSPPGCFHDGTNVSQTVREWHNHLRSTSNCEEITVAVLNFVEGRLLLGNPWDRVSADHLRDEFVKVLWKFMSP